MNSSAILRSPPRVVAGLRPRLFLRVRIAPVPARVVAAIGSTVTFGLQGPGATSRSRSRRWLLCTLTKKCLNETSHRTRLLVKRSSGEVLARPDTQTRVASRRLERDVGSAAHVPPEAEERNWRTWPPTRTRRARIVDVARRAGVSAQTVSNVINGRGGFTGPTREKVERAIAELDFQPNRYAQSLRSQRTGLIGFDMVRQQLDVTNPFTVGLLNALIPAAARHDRRVLVFTHEEGRPDEFRATATSGLVDGFVLSDSTAGDVRAPGAPGAGRPLRRHGAPRLRRAGERPRHRQRRGDA